MHIKDLWDSCPSRLQGCALAGQVLLKPRGQGRITDPGGCLHGGFDLHKNNRAFPRKTPIQIRNWCVLRNRNVHRYNRLRVLRQKLPKGIASFPGSLCMKPMPYGIQIGGRSFSYRYGNTFLEHIVPHPRSFSFDFRHCISRHF